MKKFLNVATLVAIGVLLFFVGAIIHEKNVLAYEYARSEMKILVWICLGIAVVYPLVADNITIVRNENLNTFLVVVIWGLMIALAFLFAGYLESFGNPYL
jgi:uncharacterized membrane protein